MIEWVTVSVPVPTAAAMDVLLPWWSLGFMAAVAVYCDLSLRDRGTALWLAAHPAATLWWIAPLWPSLLTRYAAALWRARHGKA